MRLIDADEYSKEMKTRQEAVEEAIKHPRKDVYYTDKEHWEGVLCDFVEAKLTLDKMPTIDAVPVVHGKWIKGGYACGENEYKCSVCGETEWRTSSARMKYCMFCGAKMDGGGADE